MNAPDDAFRQFALRLYRADGVSPAALLLQHRSGVDVNVVLLAAYVGAVGGRALTVPDLEHIERRVSPWHHDVVQPLRALRTRLTSGPPPAPTAATTALRDRIKGLELDAEMIELDELGSWATDFDVPAGPGSATEKATAAMTVVVTRAAEREPTAEERGAVALIAAAARAVGGAE